MNGVRPVTIVARADIAAGKRAFIAVGTVGATTLALYVVLRERWLRPKLRLSYGGAGNGDAVIVGLKGNEVAWVRVAVRARRPPETRQSRSRQVGSTRTSGGRSGSATSS